MKQSSLAVVAFVSLAVALASACGGDPTPRGTGGSGGDGGDGGDGGSGGSGGSGGRGGSGGGGTGGKKDAGAPDSKGPDQADSGMAGDGPGAEAGPPPVSADCVAAMPNSLFCKPLGKMPATIKETGVFPMAPNFAMRPRSLIEFTPDMPLWSDGLEKQRFILLPAGAKIDNSKPKQWNFPVGTILIKTFFDDSGMGGTPRPIETRFIRRVADETNTMVFEQFDYYLYEWNAAGTDATLVLNDMVTPETQSKEVPVTIRHTLADGKMLVLNQGRPFMHTLPSRMMCRDCHNDNATSRQTFIGFDEARLNMKRTATAAKTQMQEFGDMGLFKQPVTTTPETIKDDKNDGGLQLRVKRWIFGNCVHCHDGSKVVDLHPDNLLANTVNKDTEAQSVMPPAGWKRIIPGSPMTSVVFVQSQRTMVPPMSDTVRLRPMPPVGVADVAADPNAIADLRAWIMALPRQ